MGRTKTLAKNTLIFGIGSVSTKLIGFLMVPLYTYAFSPELFGVTDLIFTIIMILTPVVALNIHESLMRFSLDKEHNSDNVVVTAFIIIIKGFIISLLLIPILIFIPVVKQFSLNIYFLVISTAFYYSAQSYVKGTEKIMLYTWGSIICTFSIAILNILFLVVFKLSINGYLLAYTISYFFAALVMFIFGGVVKSLRRGKKDKQLTIVMLKYSIALVPNSLFWWVINSSNRIIIALFLGPAANGLYAISNKVPTVLNSITTIFQQSWQLSAIKDKDSVDSNQYSMNVFSYFYRVLIIACSFLIFFNRLLIKYIVNERYLSAWKYTPILVLAFFILSLASFFGTYYSVNKNTVGMFKSSIVGALFSLGFGIPLIFFFELQGASFATLIGYLAVFFYRYFDTKKYVHGSIFCKPFVANVLLISIQSMTFLIDKELVFYSINIVVFAILVMMNRSLLVSSTRLLIKFFSSLKLNKDKK